VPHLVDEPLQERLLRRRLRFRRRVQELAVQPPADLRRVRGVVDPHHIPADHAVRAAAVLVEVFVVEEEVGLVEVALAVVDGVDPICCWYEMGSSWMRPVLCIIISRSAPAMSTPIENAVWTTMRKL